MTSIDTVLLDIDGTLIDSTYLHALAWERAFATVDLQPAWWQVHRTIGMGGDKLVAQVCGEDAETKYGEQLREEWQTQYKKVMDEVRALDGAAEFVASLKKQGLKVALASSGAKEFTEHAMKLLGLSEDDVDAVTCSDDAEESKPEPDILKVALSNAGGTRAVVIGDSIWDAKSAEKLDAPCIGVRTGGFGEAELLESGCVAVRDSIADLIDFDFASLDR